MNDFDNDFNDNHTIDFVYIVIVWILWVVQKQVFEQHHHHLQNV